MQQKVNQVTIAGIDGAIEYTDVLILRGQEGIYIETDEIIGKDNDGNDLNQNKLIMYPWEKVLSLTWTEKTLIESVKQAAILEALQDLEEFLEDYEEDDDESDDNESEDDVVSLTESAESSDDTRDNPEINPYD
jgi:hypothetical protein